MPRGGRRRSSRGPAKDWVQNYYTYNYLDGFTMTAGVLGGVALPLTFSDQSRVLDIAGDELAHSWASIPEGKGPRTYAVKGHIVLEPVTWTAGQSFTAAFRIGAYGQDWATLGVVVPNFWSLLGPECHIAADEPFAWQEIVSEIVGPAGSPVRRYTIKVDATVNRRLANDEALFLMGELGEGSQDTRCWCQLRTLMAIEDG